MSAVIRYQILNVYGILISQNEDWKQMFGTADVDKNSHASTANSGVKAKHSQQQQQQQQEPTTQQSKQQTTENTDQNTQQGICQVKDNLQTSQVVYLEELLLIIAFIMNKL